MGVSLRPYIVKEICGSFYKSQNDFKSIYGNLDMLLEPHIGMGVVLSRRA